MYLQHTQYISAKYNMCNIHNMSLLNSQYVSAKYTMYLQYTKYEYVSAIYTICIC